VIIKFKSQKRHERSNYKYRGEILRKYPLQTALWKDRIINKGTVITPCPVLVFLTPEILFAVLK